MVVWEYSDAHEGHQLKAFAMIILEFTAPLVDQPEDTSHVLANPKEAVTQLGVFAAQISDEVVATVASRGAKRKRTDSDAAGQPNKSRQKKAGSLDPIAVLAKQHSVEAMSSKIGSRPAAIFDDLVKVVYAPLVNLETEDVSQSDVKRVIRLLVRFA